MEVIPIHHHLDRILHPRYVLRHILRTRILLTSTAVFWYFFLETAQLFLEEIAKNFGDDVAVHVNDATTEQREKLDASLKKTDLTHLESDERFSVIESDSVAPELKA
jgi:hypothetical protein